jgi:hypothetical protein
LTAARSSVTVVGSSHSADVRPIDPIACVAADGAWAVVAGQLWVVVLRDLVRRHAIRVHRDIVSACAVSQRFDAVAAGTADGSLLLWSCEGGALVRAIDLGRCVPTKIAISPAWGFVLSACEEIVGGRRRHTLCVHTINGQPIRRVEVKGAIDFWYCWTSREGIDFVFYVTEFGRCSVAEVYRIDKPKYVLSVQGSVMGAYYENDISAMAIATSAGQILFVPLRIQ